ncbi:N-6 DNA methylase [Leptolyngbya sp. FACHB-16]|nr:N-6 DNA methylase [Leptolyngbya sp. FACHB-16]
MKRKHMTQQSLNSYIRSICDIMRRSNCAGAMQYVPEVTWILFLRILEEQEEKEFIEASSIGWTFTPSLESPYRWRDWAAPYDPKHFIENPDDTETPGWVRYQLSENGGGKAFASFREERETAEEDVSQLFKSWVNDRLLPSLRKLRTKPNATPRQKIISQIMSGVERTRIDTQKNLLDILDKVHEISAETVDDTHIFPLSQVYEGLLLKMGEKKGDGGQFFTPREIIRVMVKVVNPKIGETVYDGGLGTGGFLAESYNHMLGEKRINPQTQQVTFANIKKPQDLEILKHRTFYGREKDNFIYPIALANLVLHGIDEPHIWHGNALTGAVAYGDLFAGAPEQFKVILMNPPFGGKEGKEAQTNFNYKTSATQVLYLQHVVESMQPDGRCGIVLDEGVLFRTDQSAFVDVKRYLLNECNLYCIVSLPQGTFVAAGGGVKANLLFFNKGEPTEKIWYYDLSDVKVGKRTPLTRNSFEEFLKLLPTRADSDRSWTVDITERKHKAAEQAAPFKEQASSLAEGVRRKRAILTNLKLERKQSSEEYHEIEHDIKGLERKIRELQAEVKTIEDAVYDLKPINPNAKKEEDKRTPNQLLEFIRAKGQEVDRILDSLQGEGLMAIRTNGRVNRNGKSANQPDFIHVEAEEG